MPILGSEPMKEEEFFIFVLVGFATGKIQMQLLLFCKAPVPGCTNGLASRSPAVTEVLRADEQRHEEASLPI
jgi:hypothetical protein